MFVDVDIRKKCRNRCTCPKSAGLITTKTGSLKNAADYGYCTHEKDSGERIKGLNYGRQSLQIENGNSSIPFTDTHGRSEVVTVYYREDSNRNRIKVPLILGIKDHKGAGYTWYENLGGNNLTWKKIEDTHDFPKSDSGLAGPLFKENLDRVACSLHNLHKVDISNDGQNSYYCKICTKSKVTLTHEKIQEIYAKINHSPQESTPYHVTHERNLVKYKETSEHSKLLSVNKNDTISVFYWEGDDKRENPLLIEVKSSKAESTWYENLWESGTKKHVVWKRLESTGTSGFSSYGVDLKVKLDSLSCALNKAVRIKLGLDSGCHDSRDTKHNNRIKAFHNGTVDKAFFLSAYEYSNNKPDGGPFSVAELLVQGARQTFPGATFFKDVTKLSSYASFCDPTNPFLLCIEFGNNSDKKYQWYWKKDKGNDWQVYGSFSTKSSRDVNSQIGGIFTNVKGSLMIKTCIPHKPPKEGVKINITEQPRDEKLSGTYQATSGTTPVLVLISRDDKTLPHGFFSITHKPLGTGYFKLSRNLGNGDQIGKGGGTIPDAKEVSVYYWNGEPTLPILLGITTKDSSKPKYYSRGNQRGSSWIQGDNASKKFEYLLDEYNCQRNNAVPFNLSDPENSSNLYTDGQVPPCIKDHRKIESTVSPKHPLGGEYAMKEYTVNGDARISRVTFSRKDTDMATKYTITKVLVYYRKNENRIDNIPLLVGFVKSDNSGSIFFENLGSPYYTKWKPIGESESKSYYDKGGFGSTPQQALTDKLDEVGCRVNHIVKINISNKGNPDKYCHKNCTNKRIKVINTNISISGYTGYDHTSAIKAQKTFTVTAIINNGKEKNANITSFFPLREVLKVTVYFQNCNGLPVAIHIQKEKGEEWLKNENGNEQLVQFNPNDNELQNCRGIQGLPITQGTQSTFSEDSSSDSDEESQDGNPGDGNFSGLFDWSWESLVSSLAGAMIDGPTQAVYGFAKVNEAISKILPGPNVFDNSGLAGGLSGDDGATAKGLEADVKNPASVLPQPEGGGHGSDNASGVLDSSTEASALSDISPGAEPADLPTQSPLIAEGLTGLATLGYVAACGASGSITGFTYWIYKRFAGEPWVRQI
ncbi:hypothetical protein BEWA_022970 [Theileria equi strain WA]|uniref:Uncharacterized protein n=1 Tax=Theileria equi strain WA TaxID=1537102 RepID=L0AWJ6_THEEQ|nr:hypothetical protein BEWA_021320 [Theileria equi strain WA]XP_004829115.1 hypothetical protein BEWA_022970 [Theileria equi strain WA]AFZ79284.1 hypothetical protein BEWA_021320 [Theileria equi strain WA]AFZ79449.1 hypothetical protein BEWA_022970 [Theileria equi strain WA]|eukprot:XP_004828950.1 hypothetical protein BEWA_021320 [Theileria equi strain WA]